MNKNIKLLSSVVAIIFVVSLAVGAVALSFSGTAGQVCESGATCNFNEAEGGDNLGALASPYIYTPLYANAGLTVVGDMTMTGDIALTGDMTVSGGINSREANIQLTASTTLTSTNSGTTYYIDLASTTLGATVTLPAVSTATGTTFKFIVTDAFSVANVVIDSAEGDNIEGTLIVAGAVVDCASEDQIDFVNDGENIGDYLEITSDGQQWLIGDSGALTAGKLTCTDPS